MKLFSREVIFIAGRVLIFIISWFTFTVKINLINIQDPNFVLSYTLNLCRKELNLTYWDYFSILVLSIATRQNNCSVNHIYIYIYDIIRNGI